MDIFLLWRLILTAILLYTANIFSKFYGVSAQRNTAGVGSFPRSLLQRVASTCNCDRACKYEPEADKVCYSSCNCHPLRAKAIAQCNPETEQCKCPWSSDNKCPRGTQSCLFDDAVICEYTAQYCLAFTEREVGSSRVCECKDGWSGPECVQCDSCDRATSGASSSTNTALILGFVLAIVLLILIIVVVAYWRLGRLPCYAKHNAKGRQVNEKPPLAMAYSVPMTGPITHGPGQRPGILRPDADTGEVDGEYTYAAINDYAVIPNRDIRNIPPEPIASVSPIHKPEAIYYFKLSDDAAMIQPNTKATADCYTKVIRKPKPEDQPQPQYDRLDRLNNGRPSPNGDRGSPNDNEYGTLASSI